MGVELQTDRLILRPLELADAAQTQLLFPHWEAVNDYWFDILGFKKLCASEGDWQYRFKTHLGEDGDASDRKGGTRLCFWSVLNEIWELTAEEWQRNRIAMETPCLGVPE